MKKILFIIILLSIVISFSNTETNFNLPKKQEIKIVDNNNVINKELEEYIIGVVAGEMPALYEKEALKAQAVASRTYAISKMRDNSVLKITTDDQVYLTQEQMEEKWKDDYEKYYKIIETAVNETKGEILYYGNIPIKAFYYASSNGYTESCEDVFLEQYDYLKIQPSIDKDNYDEITISKEEFCNKLDISCNKIEINNIEKNKSNRIEKIEINNKIFKGTEIRKLLNIKSTDFEIIELSNAITIKTNGYGHGVGMSQKGANLLAKDNYTYREILEYYYPNTIIRNI